MNRSTFTLSSLLQQTFFTIFGFSLFGCCKLGNSGRGIFSLPEVKSLEFVTRFASSVNLLR
jgi:hypothetical protein